MDLRLDRVSQRARHADIRSRWRPMAASDQAGRQDEASSGVRPPDQVTGQPGHGRRFHRERSQAVEPPQEAPQGVRGVHVVGCKARRQQRSCQDGEEQWLRVRGHHLRTGPRAGEHRKLDAEHPALEPSIRCKLRRHIEAAFGCLGGGCCFDSFPVSGSLASFWRISFQIPLPRSILTFLLVIRFRMSGFFLSEALLSAMHFYGVMAVLVWGIGLGIHRRSQRCAFDMSHSFRGGTIAFIQGGIVRWFTKSYFTLVRVYQYTPSSDLDIYTKDFAVNPHQHYQVFPSTVTELIGTLQAILHPADCFSSTSQHLYESCIQSFQSYLTTPERPPNLTSDTLSRTSILTAQPCTRRYPPRHTSLVPHSTGPCTIYSYEPVLPVPEGMRSVSQLMQLSDPPRSRFRLQPLHIHTHPQSVK